MSIPTWLGALAPLLLCAAQEPADTPAQEEAPATMTPVTWEVPGLWLTGSDFRASLRIEAPKEGMELPAHAFGPGAFAVGESPLGPRLETTITLQPGQVVETVVDLSAALEALAPQGAFEVRCTLAGAGAAQSVLSPVAIEEEIDFMTIPAEELDSFEVVMMTNRGVMWFELWPDVAPNHVRNFLDLTGSGFYDGSNFHRVIPGFMIQGGGGKPGTQPPRKVDAEFNARKHEAGVLSAARLGNDINSATSQFFVMHRNYPSLNGRYSPFGKLKSGMDVVEKIVVTGDSRYSPNSPKGYTPTTPQLIERAIVVRATKD